MTRIGGYAELAIVAGEGWSKGRISNGDLVGVELELGGELEARIEGLPSLPRLVVGRLPTGEQLEVMLPLGARLRLLSREGDY